MDSGDGCDWLMGEDSNKDQAHAFLFPVAAGFIATAWGFGVFYNSAQVRSCYLNLPPHMCLPPPRHVFASHNSRAMTVGQDGSRSGKSTICEEFAQTGAVLFG